MPKLSATAKMSEKESLFNELLRFYAKKIRLVLRLY